MVFDYFKSREIFETKPDEVCYVPENNEGDPEDRYTRNDIVEMCDGDELKADVVFDSLSWEHPGCILDQWDDEDDEALEELRGRVMVNTKLGEIQMLFEKAQENDWTIEHENDNIYLFGKYSSAGQDFSITIDTEANPELFLHNLYERYSDFDVSEEASHWLDESGHGKNGALYDMKDVYEDMEECRDNVLELYSTLYDYYHLEINKEGDMPND